jgi:hypothetical protein
MIYVFGFGMEGSQITSTCYSNPHGLQDLVKAMLQKKLRDQLPPIYTKGYYLADGIYSRWSIFVKIMFEPLGQKKAHLASRQES